MKSPVVTSRPESGLWTMDSVEWVREDENPEYSQKLSDANYLDSLEKAKQISSNKQASSPVEYQGQTVLVTPKRRVSSTSSSNDHLSQSSSNVSEPLKLGMTIIKSSKEEEYIYSKLPNIYERKNMSLKVIWKF
ncbi:hypothetical protein BY996DRAFT_8450051 [Phakopsora pachyrhizi]|nr:hypothetical protein BY996DRAFT_8450051 [Phakopsora pachyrhizi]